MQIQLFDRSICTHDPSTNITFSPIQLQCRFNYNADSTIRSIPTYIAFIYSINQSLLISFIYLINQKKVLREPYLGVVVVAEKEASADDDDEEAGVDGGGGGEGGRCRRRRWSRERRRLRKFGMKSRTTRGELLFICSKISTMILN
jgi:hypothetical protein